MKFSRFWRVFGTVIGFFYAVLAFNDAQADNKLWVLIECLVAALYFNGAAKSHSRLKNHRHRPPSQ